MFNQLKISKKKKIFLLLIRFSSHSSLASTSIPCSTISTVVTSADATSKPAAPEEYLDVLTTTGEKTGVSKPRYAPAILSIASPGWLHR